MKTKYFIRNKFFTRNAWNIHDYLMNMLNHRYFIAIALLALVFSSCQDLKEDPKSSITPNNWFQTQADLDGSVTAIYAGIIQDWGISNESFLVFGFGADDLSTHPGSNKEELRAFDELNANASIWRINSNWRVIWGCINQANQVIANYQKVNSTEDLKNGSAAQAYFLRAYFYYRLVHQFGQLPLVLKPTDVDTRLPRVPVKDIYDAIESDLKTAITLFPSTFPTKSNRANPLAARALLADVYLDRSGWPLNEPDKFALAADYAKQVIDASAYSLVPDYATCFTTNDNQESIFAFKFNMAGLVNRTQGQFAIPETEASIEGGNTGWNEYCTEKNFYRYAPKCKRSWQTFYDTLKLMSTVNGKTVWKKVPWTESPLKQVFFKKFRYGLGVPGNGDGCTETDSTIIRMSPSSGKDAVVLRYAGVLLTYAEAATMAAGSPTPEAYNAINLVRHRAGLGDLTPGLSGTAFRDSVVHERAYEFAGEFGVRWFDIQRLQLLPQVIAARASDEPNPISMPSVDLSTRYYSPIPMDEMNSNPTWTQNPGY